MRVIAGKYKGRKLYEPKDDLIRPTRELIREAVFSSLQNKISDSIFVDLFSGTGAIGIEALSRGAKKVFFLDNDEKAIELIKKNLGAFVPKENYVIIKGDYSKIKTLPEKTADIIYIDPPYEKANYIKIINNIFKAKILKTPALLIIERSKTISLNYKSLNINEDNIKTKKYGKTMIDYFQFTSKDKI